MITPRTKVLLGLLGLALALMLWKQFGPQEDPTTAPAGLAAGDGAGGAAARGRSRQRRAGEAEIKSVADLAELKLAQLDATPPGFSAGRNPFAFLAPPPTPPPPPPPGPTPEQIAEKEKLAREMQEKLALQRAQEALIPKPPAITFSYVGSFGPPNRRIAVLSDGNNTYNAMVGDVIEGKFRLEAIGFESIEIGYVDFPNLPAAQLPVGEEGGP